MKRSILRKHSLNKTGRACSIINIERRSFVRVIWFPLLSSVGTMALLYWIGNIFNLSLLRFSFALNEPLENGLIFDANIAILPFAIGLIVGFIVQRIVKVRSKRGTINR